MGNDERSEKIHTLAKTLVEQSRPAAQQSYSLKTMALMALLSAGAASGVSVVAVEHYRPLNHYEKTELRALLHYAAKMRLQPVAALEADFLAQFAAVSLDDLTLAQMDAARRYLQMTITTPATR